jgi:DNA-binding PadR family transcriptional regulator
MTPTMVLQALVNGHRYGFDVMDATGLPSGVVYPALGRLEKDGLVTSRWEDSDRAREDGRPPRRYYQVTDDGERALETALLRLDAMRRLSAAGPGKS